jgi:hypothetical protein
MAKSLGFNSLQQQTRKHKKNCIQMGIFREHIKERTDNHKQIQNRPFPYYSLISNN